MTTIDLPDNYDEITVAMVGSVDSGKSTLTGVLCSGSMRQGFSDMKEALDDGNGLARTRILHHQHEQESGRTSSITYNYAVYDFVDSVNNGKTPRTVSFVDLAGHEMYLKTTIHGLTSSYPDVAIVCVGRHITNMTKEHIGILYKMEIPFVIAMTKVDIIPTNVFQENLRQIKKIAAACKKRVYEVKNPTQVKSSLLNNKKLLQVVRVSNKSGEGIETLVKLLMEVNRNRGVNDDVFVVEHIYKNIPGFGTVVSGLTGKKISIGDKMLLGPFAKGKYINVKVRSLHNDYRQFVDSVEPGMRCCCCIKYDNEYKDRIRSGMILTTEERKSSDTFRVKMEILNHHTTISPGYEGYINCGNVRDVVKVVDIVGDKTCVRSGDKEEVIIKLRHQTYVSPGSKFLMREGATRSIGVFV